MSEAPRSDEEIRTAVRARYAVAAGRRELEPLPLVSSDPCCGGDASSSQECCSDYSAEELASLPAGAHLGLGCGNPSRLASLRPGDVVLDLGSGAGVDCFLAADRVGDAGRVIGVDMTPEMVARARKLAREAGRARVEFRLGEIEHLPVADASVDVVLSNCVVNLSADKPSVYREAFRVLRPGGRLVISDMVATRPIPREAQADLERWSSCSTGALTVREIEEILRGAGFSDVSISLPPPIDPSSGTDDLGVVSAVVRATRPR